MAQSTSVTAPAAEQPTVADRVRAGGEQVGRFFVDLEQQERAMQGVNNGVDSAREHAKKAYESARKQASEAYAAGRKHAGNAYTAIQNNFHKADNYLDTKSHVALHTPISKMANFTIAHRASKQTDTTLVALRKTIINATASYHTAVVRKGEAASRTVAAKVEAFTSAVLTPLQIVAKLFGVEVLGTVLRKGISQAMAFVARGIVLATSQLFGHTLPYVLTAAAIGGAIAGAYLLAQASPIGALALLTAVAILGQGALNINLMNKVDQLRNDRYENDDIFVDAPEFEEGHAAATSDAAAATQRSDTESHSAKAAETLSVISDSGLDAFDAAAAAAAAASA